MGFGRIWFLSIILSVIIISSFISPALAQQTGSGATLTHKERPDRNGDLPGKGEGVNSCPPYYIKVPDDPSTPDIDETEKITPPPDPSKGDKNVDDSDNDDDGDETDPEDLDYFMGEYKFVEGDINLIIREWCVDSGEPLGWFFTWEVYTSILEDGEHVETRKINATAANCPYLGGQNISSGYKDKKEGEPIPKKIDWISKNPHPEGDIAPDEDYQKRIIIIKDDQTVAKGKIIKHPTGEFTLSGEFQVGDEFKRARDLTEKERQKIITEIFEPEKKAVDDYYRKTEKSKSCDMDADNDKVDNAGDNCPTVFNKDQSDFDEDGIGNLCESPREQINLGIDNSDIYCKAHFDRIFKLDGNVACVKPSSVEPLLERGWLVTLD